MDNKKTAGNSSLIDQKDVKNTLITLGKNWYWFVVFIALGLAASIAYLYKATKYYGATTEILVKQPKDPFKDALSDALPLPTKKEDLANEMQVLTSSQLIGETINQLNLDISYYIKGRLITGEVYKGTPFNVEGKISDKSLYNQPFSLRILNNSSFKVEIITDDFKFSKVAHFGDPVVNSKFSFIVTSDSAVIRRNAKISDINFEFKFHDHASLIQHYKLHALKAEKDPNATVISLSVEDPVQAKAIDFINTLTNNYIENSVAVNKKVNENTLEFIEGQLREVESQLNSVEGNLEQFQKEKTTFNLGNEQSVLFQRVVDFDTEKAKLGIQLKSIDMMYEYLTSSVNDNMAISPAILAEQNDPSLTSSFNELFALQQRRSNLLFSNTSNSPLVKEIDAQISIVKQNILGIVLTLRKTLVSKINSLSGQVGEYQNSIRQMPTTQRGLVNINRNVEIYSKIYEFLLQTRAQTIIAKAAIVADKFVLEPAYGTGLLRPIRVKTIASGLGIGLAISLLLIFFKGVFYNYIQTKEDLKLITELPIIGVVGQSKEGISDYLVVNKFPQSQVSEAFRVIRTNLNYFAPKVHSKIVIVTSSIAGEGKTFCAINTATILAKAKKKVVLIDLDLHKPKQANAFDLNNDVGLTSYIVGKAALKDIIKPSPVENLEVILTGPRSPNASELILDPMMEQLLTELKSKYEYIIIDSPPAGLLSDALELMKFADLTMYVLKAGYSKREFVEIAHQIVEKNNIKNLTFVLNCVSSKNIPAGYGAGYYS